jgi:selenocysteine lyase/cysteine desulfurase
LGQSSGGTCCIALGPHRAAVESALEQRGVRYDLRDDVLRASFHIYNDEADAHEVGAALAAAAQGRP